jgi:hypothetical protein
VGVSRVPLRASPPNPLTLRRLAIAGPFTHSGVEPEISPGAG